MREKALRTDLLNEESHLSVRIDHVFVRNNFDFLPFSVVGPVFSFIIGDGPSDKAVSGMWTSYHLGVVTGHSQATGRILFKVRNRYPLAQGGLYFIRSYKIRYDHLMNLRVLAIIEGSRNNGKYSPP